MRPLSLTRRARNHAFVTTAARALSQVTVLLVALLGPAAAQVYGQIAPTQPATSGLHLHVDVHGDAPANAKPALERHLRSCLSPEASVAPLLVELRWARVQSRYQVVVDVTWGAARLGARLLQGRQPAPLIEAAAVATCVALDQALAAPEVTRRALRRERARSQRRRRMGPAQWPVRATQPPQGRGSGSGGGAAAAEVAFWRVHLGALAAFAQAPATTGGVSAALSVRRGAASARLDVRALVPAQLRVGAGQVQSSTAALVASVCGHVGPLALCPLASVGLRFSASAGLDRATSVRTLDGEIGGRLWFAGRSGGESIRGEVTQGALALGALTLGVWAEATLPWVRTRLRTSGDVVWQRSGVAATLGVEVGWRPGG